MEPGESGDVYPSVGPSARHRVAFSVHFQRSLRGWLRVVVLTTALYTAWNASLVAQRPDRYGQNIIVAANWGANATLTDKVKLQVLRDMAEMFAKEKTTVEHGGQAISGIGSQVTAVVADITLLQVTVEGISPAQVEGRSAMLKDMVAEFSAANLSQTYTYAWPELEWATDSGAPVKVPKPWVALVVWPFAKFALGSLMLGLPLAFWLAAWRHHRPIPPPLAGTVPAPRNSSFNVTLIRGLWIPLVAALVIFGARAQMLLNGPVVWISLATIQFEQSWLERVLPVSSGTDRQLAKWLTRVTQHKELVAKAVTRARLLYPKLKLSPAPVVEWLPGPGEREMFVICTGADKKACEPVLSAFLDEFRAWFDEDMAAYADQVFLRVTSCPTPGMIDPPRWMISSIIWAAVAAGASFALLVLSIALRERARRKPLRAL